MESTLILLFCNENQACQRLRQSDMSAIQKGKIDWKNVKTGKKQQRENDGTGFSLHLEAACWNGKQTGAPPSERSARSPKDLAAAARAQTRGGLGALGRSLGLNDRAKSSRRPCRTWRACVSTGAGSCMILT